MPPISYAEFDFDQRRIAERWVRVAQFVGDWEAFASFVNNPTDPSNQRFGPFVMTQVKRLFEDVATQVGPDARNRRSFTIFLDEGKSQNFVSLAKRSEGSILVWSCWRSEQEQREHDTDLDGAGCLRKLGVLAADDRQGIRLRLPEQEDRAFMWKAPSVHPLQVLENGYQRVVHKAERDAGADAARAQSDVLSKYFIQDAAVPARFTYEAGGDHDGKALATVRMNHLIDSFYLFRLLVRYEAESSDEISEELRMELSGNLTKLLHNGDPAKMSWLAAWLTKTIAQIGRKINALNPPDRKRVIFFLKGGRALNYYLGTPERGENDWDTQVVIDPSLPAEEWYQCFADVHDVVLEALTEFKTQFTKLVEENAAPFAEYLKTKAGPAVGDDEEIDEYELSDGASRCGHASCKAELIDIGIPRRDAASALEEWTRLSSANALKVSGDGIIVPHREYYLNEYLMMIREAFLPSADVRKAPKRITRFGLILESDGEEGPSAIENRRLAALPETAQKIAAITRKGRRDLFTMVMSQFVEAYNLLQDKELAAHVDKECVARIASPPRLPTRLTELLDDAQAALAADVGVAHEISVAMSEHWESRSQFFEEQRPFFVSLVRDLSHLTTESLERVDAQFAVAGSFAARLHAEHLRVAPVGLEPIRRILIKLQCVRGRSQAAVLDAVRATITKAAEATGKLTVTRVAEGDKEALVLYWSKPITIGKLTYAPLVMKVRAAEQRGTQLPVLSSIDGVPVLDLRYLVADYLKKTAKIDERGSRQVLASATRAVSEMLSRFDVDSDDEG